jgi:hypothetical protein
MSEADTVTVTVTAADVAGLNQPVVARAAKLTHRAGAALVVVGALGVLAWAWITLRGLGLLGDSFAGFGDTPDFSFDDRVDLIAGYFSVLLYASLVAGAGLGLRLLADYAVTRTGGSLTGVQEGEPLYAIRRRSLPVPPGGSDGEDES